MSIYMCRRDGTGVKIQSHFGFGFKYSKLNAIIPRYEHTYQASTCVYCGGGGHACTQYVCVVKYVI
jgi:hypothetical protein